MKIKQIGKIIIFLGIILISMLIFSNQSNASSFSVKASTSSVNIGDNYTVTISGNNITGKFAIKGNGNVTINSETNVWIENNSATVSVTAKNAGTGTITVTAIDVADSTTGEDIANSLGAKTCNVTIKEKTTATQPNTTTEKPTTNTNKKSSNNNLSNLGIQPNDFSGFKPGTTTYSVTVPENVEEITVYAKPQDSNSTISGTGKIALKKGENKITVTCKAENGSTKTYTINITRESQEEIENQTQEPVQEKPIEESEKLKLESLSIEGVDLKPEFSSDIFEYNIELNNSNTDKLEIQAKSNYEQAQINIIGNENLKTGINQIVIEVKLEESDKSVRYTLNVNKIEETENSDEIIKLKEEARNRNILLIVISIIMIVSLTLNVLHFVKNKWNK